MGAASNMIEKSEMEYVTPRKDSQDELNAIKEQNEKLKELMLMFKFEQTKRDSNNACCHIF